MSEKLLQYDEACVLVTGGAGCVGSNLTRMLLAQNVGKILVLDNLSSSEKWNIIDDERVRLVQGSVLDDEILRSVFAERPDYIFHLAAHFANQNSVENPENDLMVNGLGTLKVLQYANLTKIKRLVYASSGCSVYGSQAPLPLKEDFVSIHLDTPYQITKLLGELYCNFFHDYYKLPVVRARLFNVYGPGEVPGKYRNVIPNFIYWALHGQPLPITGTGEETRDFTYVDDIAAGMLQAGVVPEAIGEAFNLASGSETKIMDIAHIVNRLTANNGGIRFTERRSWDKITRRRASIEKAKRSLNYNPKTEINSGVERTLKWFTGNSERIQASARF